MSNKCKNHAIYNGNMYTFVYMEVYSANNGLIVTLLFAGHVSRGAYNSSMIA